MACPLSGHSARPLSFVPLARLVTRKPPCVHWWKKAWPHGREREVAANEVFLLSKITLGYKQEIEFDISGKYQLQPSLLLLVEIYSLKSKAISKIMAFLF